MENFTAKENETLMPLVADCVNYVFSEKEALTYIMTHLGRQISAETYYRRKKRVDGEKYANEWLNYFSRVSFVIKHKQILEVVEMVQKDTIRDYLIEQNKSHELKNKGDKTVKIRY
jgi:hypothetical protein